MPTTSVTVSHEVDRTPRVMQVEALFDTNKSTRLTQRWNVDLPIESRDWNVGLIVGPSGAGKSTIARKLFDTVIGPGELAWPRDRALVDAFPDSLSIKEITGLLSSVGLASVPAWIRPYSTLSTGEAFRASVARILAELGNGDVAVVDEWTSTVDRQVATVASHAVQKAVRARGQKLVAVTCHYDVEDWLQPDWVYQPHVERFTWRSVQPRPRVELDIRPVHRSSWRIFAPHHYLTASLPSACRCYGGFVGDECVAFIGVAGIPHRSPQAQRIRRTRRMVVLPDWQGLGIGTRMEESLAEFYCAKGYRFRALTAHPGLVKHYLRSPRWLCDRRPDDVVLVSGKKANKALSAHQAEVRMLQTYAFEYVPRS